MISRYFNRVDEVKISADCIGLVQDDVVDEGVKGGRDAVELDIDVIVEEAMDRAVEHGVVEGLENSRDMVLRPLGEVRAVFRRRAGLWVTRLCVRRDWLVRRGREGLRNYDARLDSRERQSKSSEREKEGLHGWQRR